MGGLECVITGLMDEYQEFFRRRGISREVFTGFVVFSSYLVAITCVTPVSLSSPPHNNLTNILTGRVLYL